MKQRGFTLIEAILTLTILAGGIVGVLTLYQRNIANSDEMEQTLIATLLAEEKLEQIVHDKKYKLYPYIVTANYPATENLTAEGYPAYTRTITIQEVRSTDLITPQSGTGYKRVTVGVSITGGPTITFDTLLTQWGEF
ncbi:MAG: prepilin-type N-terminal cleavage/methylation domain-containing protein [Deltaproteobacteria bacterium]|nr:prepilin-type N-terminal cleavage/methylation domain-containing protein [Deltaproteobacteria bacterium]